MLKVYRILVFALPLALAGFANPAAGQGSSASINGTVTDSSGAIVPNAKVTIQNTGTGLTQVAMTNASGNYVVSPLPAGQYQITVQCAGFQKVVQTGIELTVNQAATLNFALKVGSQQETVSVTANEELIDQTSASVSSVIDEHAIKDLPLNGRDPSSLVFLAPGVTNVLNSSVGTLQTSDSFPNETGASAGGGRQGSTYYMLDGVPNMDTYLLLAAPFPNSDATQEFRVITNNFDAQYGFSPGAVVSIGTKSGTNQFHGGAFEFIRNNALNAGNYFTHLVDSLKRNQFGLYAGGPIFRDKLFVFGNYQGTRESTAASTNTMFTPTAAMLNGDFSAVPVALGDPFATVNGVPNQVNPALFSKAAVTIATTALPLGQVPSSGEVNYVMPQQTDTYNEGTGRLDYTINNRQRMFARSFIQYYDVPGQALPGDLVAVTPSSTGRYYNEVINHTWVISPSIVNNASASWVRMDFSQLGEAFDKNNDAVCMSRYVNVADPPNTCYLEGLSVSNGFNSQWTEPNRNIRTTWWVSDGATITVKNHTISAGVNLVHQWANTLTDYPAQPIISFSGYATGFGLADFLLGDVSSLLQGGIENSPTRGWQLGLYGQDQYKIRPNITITAGLRWEPNLPPEAVNGGANFIPGEQSQRYPNAPTGLVFPGDPGVSSALMPTTYKYFEPRVGVAWQPRSLPHTALRAGFGLFTAPLSYSYYNHTAAVSPFSPTYTLNASAANPISFANPWANFLATGGVSPFPPFTQNPKIPASEATFLTPLDLGATFSPNFRLGVTQSWTLSIEQQLWNDFALHLAYVGSQSYHQTVDIDQNPGIYADGGARTRFTQFSTILEDQPVGTASYHSLEVGLEKHLSRGLQFQTNFTWSKSIDLWSNGNISFGSDLANPFDFRWDRGISNLNIPLSSITNLVYTTPKLAGSNVLTRNALGAWEFSIIWTFQSGQPFSISGGNGNNNSGSLQYGDRADLTGQPFEVHQGSKTQWLTDYFNPAAFTVNAPGTFGTSGRNILQGPGINTADVAIIKNWQVERYGLQFRWEMFNAFNHASFGLPNSDPSSGNFGQITSIGSIPPRVMQGALKFSF